MTRSLLLTFSVILVAGCTDRTPTKVLEPDASSATAQTLTMKTLPASASSVCRASVRERDRLRIVISSATDSKQASVVTAQSRVKGLDAQISDTCF